MKKFMKNKKRPIFRVANWTAKHEGKKIVGETKESSKKEAQADSLRHQPKKKKRRAEVFLGSSLEAIYSPPAPTA